MSDLVRYDPLEHGRLVGGLKEYRGFTQKDARAAADDTALTRGFKNSMRSARMGWNALTGDKEELGRLKAEDMDYRKIQEGRKSQARRELGEAWEKGGGVGGGLSNVWGELKKDWREKGLDGALEDVGEMAGAVLEQAPNALVPIATTTAGGILGALAGGNAAVGAYAGATLGNTLMEYGGQLDRAAEAAGVDPADKDAVMAFIGRGAPGALKNAAVKGAVVGAADMAAMKLGGSILNMGKKAAGKAALEKMGVAAAVAAAKGTPEFAALAKESAKGGLGGAARHAAAYATESAGEFAGEYLGTGLANGEWDEKGAALEAFSSLGHSAVGFAGTKAYAAVTDPLRPPAGRKAGAEGGIGGNRKAGRPAPEGAQALRAAADGGAEQGGAGFDTAHHDQSHPALRQFADRTKQEEAGRFFSGPADGNTPRAEELARGTEKQPDVSGIPSEDGAEFLDTGVMPDGLARQYADMAAEYRAKPSEAVGINPDDGAVSAAAALAADSGAAVPSAVSDDMEARSVADDVPSGRSADADRGGVPSAYGNVRPGGAPRGAASVAPGGSAAAASGGIARVSPLPAGQYFDGLDTRGRKALAKEAGLDIKGVADFGQIAAPVRRKIEQAYHARIEADYQAASEAKQGYLPPPVRMADAVPVPKKGFSVPADALDKESRRRFDALPEWVRRHAQTVADYTADGIMRREAGMADMRGHYPEGLAESAGAVRAYRAQHPESADVLDRLNRAVYGYRRNNGWSVPLLSREGERLQGVRTALPDDGASEAVVGGGRGLTRALPTEDKGLAQDVRQDVRQGLTQGGRGLTPDAGADANAAALQGLPGSAVASGNAPARRQNLQVRARAEGAAPGLSASENLAGTDGGKRAPVAGKRPDTVLPVLNPQVAESAGRVSPKKRMADAAADFTRRLAADRRRPEKAGVPLGGGEYRFEHTDRRHIDALAGVPGRPGKGGMPEEFADMAGPSNSDGLVSDGRRYLKGREAETLRAGGLSEAVPSEPGRDYRPTQEARAPAKVMARPRDAASAGKPAGRAQPARAKDAPVAGKAAAAKNAATEKPSSDKVRNIEAGKSHFDGGKGKSAAAQGAATEKPSSDKAAEPETFAKTALDNPEEARRKARVLQGGPVYTVKGRQAPQGFKALREHAENIKKRLAESIGGLAERVDVAAVSETAPDKAQMLLSQRVEGWFDGRTGKITLVAENLTPERAVWAAWHELGHRGFAADGFAKYRAQLERADGNGLIRRIADAVQEGREGTGDAAASVRPAAVEEAVAELYAAQRTGGWAGIENRYGVKVGNGLKRGIAGVLARIGALLRRVLQRLAGKAGGAMSDADVFAMLADLHGNVEGARDAPWGGNHRAVMFARAEDGAAERSKSESLEKLRRAETIRISGREVPEGGNLREYKRNALEYGKSLRGPYVNKDTGREISLGRSGITEILRHDYKDAEHLQSIAAIPQIIENAVYIDTLPNEDLAKNGDIQGYEYYVSGLNVGGADYTVRAAVAVSRNGNRYYDHKLTKIEKGNLLSLLDRVSTTGASESKSPLSGIDDKRLLQILQDKDAGKGGIADFDTEAVRFSRAANIGAAISRITGKKSDLRNALKDRWDASKGIQLQFLGRRQIEDIYGGVLDGLKEYGRLSELFGADANKAVTEADKVVREWGRLKEEDAKALADLMHDATLAKVDADPLMRKDARGRLDGIRTALDIADGKIAKARAAVASAGARTARADAAYNKAQRAADKAAYALEKAQEKHGREILADEADMRLRRLFYADSEAKRALRRAGADAAAESRAKTDAVRMLEQARADVKRLEKDEVGAQKALEGLALLNRRFAGLPDAAQRVYRKARDDYRAHFGQVRDALAERLARAGQDAETVRRLKERFDNELGGVYFPLARFGDYLVVVKDADGNSANVSRAETLSEAEKLRDALKADFGPGFKVSPVMKSRDYIRSRDAVGSGFMKELGEAVGRMDLDPAQRARLNDTLTQLYLNSLPDTSWAKHGIHRKGVPGFSDDARRAYAQNMGSGANYLAKLRYADRMAEQLDVMQDFVDGRKYEEGFDQRQLQRVADEMRKRHEAVMNPNPSKLAQALTGFGFLWMMGMSPASAVVNLSQTAMVAYPVMAAKWGYAGAARELLRASKQIGLRFGEKFNTIEDSLNGDEKAAFRKAADYGVIDLSQAHDLAGVANGDPGLAGSAWQKVMDKAAWLFHHAEKFNRQVTFVAAYRLAKRAGADSEAAFEQAKKATYDGHFDYAAQNRPRFMMGNAAKVVFLFKQYSQNILYALGRNAYLAFKGDKEARKTLAGLLVSHAMASGILGLPFVSTLLAVASMLGSDDDDPWDAEAALRNMLADTFGDKAGEVLAKGFSRLTPLDVSGRLGLDQLVFPDIQDGLEGKKWAESLVVGSTGAVVGAGIGAADGVRTRSSVPRTANTLSLMKSW
ncbi:PLxRFG domain-containing protein [Neisseria gonorrhoeae]|uniref:PLxRFG domain-containing protein n=1 Tax=Neisseria gonorrhoeae TaxID=485 RepID=UPI001F4D6E8B|nr:PLxRFG domain-containing protein [Neisseria gonorrhoeae]MCH8792314.1 PLxRFG domain-containing protein [Neisseria gonorrhoeae]